ncbi:MAG: hypothetical protein AB1898_16830 [Acidobacteriota bacterium]
MCKPIAIFIGLIFVGTTLPQRVLGEYRDFEHRPLQPGAIAVSKPGHYSRPGATYQLTQDVSSVTSPISLGKDVTLDLNGFTISYAKGQYEHVPNYGFENGLESWDLTKAPGAKIESTATVKPFIGSHILRLPAGQEIVSPYITLPVANRSYYAMCGVLSNQMRVTLQVEDEHGLPVKLLPKLGESARDVHSITDNPTLGGGFVLAHLHRIPRGKYRIRVKAETDCLIDEVDIRPALDVGISIVEQRQASCDAYKQVNDGMGVPCAFFDYESSKPPARTPVTGTGIITIRNGIIRSGFEGIRSWAIQSTAQGVMVILENVKIVAAGINTNAMQVPKARIRDCRFDIDTPFIINRHTLSDSPVSLTKADGSEVSQSEFIGGQGCLAIVGNGAKVHDNLFVNRQTVTNHYSIMLGNSDNVEINHNRFEPEIGSGVTVFRSRHTQIHHNFFRILAANANCEYTNEEYSTNAIRLTDYNDKPNAPRGAWGNRIHHNRFEIVGKHYLNYSGFKSIASAVFCSVGAGSNFIYENEISVKHQDPDSPSVACAFYIGASDNGGEWYDNQISTNVPAFWIGNFYGRASNAKIYRNTIIKTDSAPADFKPFRLGYGRHTATNIEFQDNRFEGCEFGVQSDAEGNSFSCK